MRSGGPAIALGVALTTVACGGGAPKDPVEPPRLAAVESCTRADPKVTPLPVPPRPPADPYRLSPWAAIGFSDRAGFHPGTFLCDLPSRVIVLAAEQTVEGGKRKVGGTAWAIPRPAAGSPPTALAQVTIPPVSILASSKGCLAGEVTCSWATGSADLPSLDTIGPAWVDTSGWVHGVEDMCRALPDDTIAVCSTATRMAYVELGCQDAAAPPVKLQLGIHDESLERRDHWARWAATPAL